MNNTPFLGTKLPSSRKSSIPPEESMPVSSGIIFCSVCGISACAFCSSFSDSSFCSSFFVCASFLVCLSALHAFHVSSAFWITCSFTYRLVVRYTPSSFSFIGSICSPSWTEQNARNTKLIPTMQTFCRTLQDIDVSTVTYNPAAII